jgi:hypothetical protein
LSPFIAIPITKDEQIPNFQIEHSHSIIDLNVIHKKHFDWTFYDNNVFDFLNTYPNLTYYEKTSKFINIFSNITRARSQIMNYIKYIHSKKLCKHPTNDKVQSPYVRCSSKENKQPIHVEHQIQPNKVEHHV